MNLSKSIYTSIIACIIMLVLYGLSATGLLGDNPVGQTANYVNPLIVPAGYAFSIWSIIYIGLIVFPFYQFAKRKSGDSRWKKVHTLYALNVIANGLWLAAASYDWQWISVIIIVFMLYTLVQINKYLDQMSADDTSISYWIEKFVFRVYFAWITLATALNVSSALTFYKWDGFGISEETWALIILPIVALVAGFISVKLRYIAYAGVVIWAFVAIVMKHYNSIDSIAYLAIAIVVIFAGLSFVIVNIKRQYLPLR